MYYTFPMTTQAILQGDRVRVRIGGQVLDMNVDHIIDTPLQGTMIRSETASDHVWTKVWVNVKCVIEVLVETPSADDPFRGLS